MAILDLFITKAANADAVVENVTRELEAAAAKGLEAEPRGLIARWMDIFKAKSPVPLIAQNATPAQSMDFLTKNFGDLANPEMSHIKVMSNEIAFQSAIEQNGFGKGLDVGKKANLLKTYNTQKTLLESMDQTLSQARNIAEHAGPQMLDAVEKEAIALQSSFDGLAGKTYAALADLQADISTTTHKSLFKVEKIGAKDMFVASIVNPTDATKLEKIVLGEVGGAINGREAGRASRLIVDNTRSLLAQPKEYVKMVGTAVNKMEAEVVKSKNTLDKIGTTLLGEPSIYSAAEKVVSQVSTVVSESANLVEQEARKISGAIGGVGKDAALLAQDAKVASEAKNLGLLSEEAYKAKGLFGGKLADAYTNLLGGYAERNASGTITKAEGLTKRLGIKGARWASVLGGSYFVIDGAGRLTGFINSVDEKGEPVPGDFVKNSLEIAGGLAAIGLGALVGAGSRGRMM